MGAIVTMLLVGYAGWFRTGRDILRLPTEWAHVLSLMIIANGFFLVHMIAGHLMFHTLPLMGWLLWLLFHPSRDTVRRIATRGALFGMIIAIMLYSGGFLIVMFAGMMCLFVLPFVILFDKAPFQQKLRSLGMRAIAYGSITFFLALSKIVAVYSFMRFFPRIVPFDRFASEASTLRFIFRAFWGFPQQADLFEFIRLPWPASEYSLLLSPVVFLGVLAVPLLLWIYWRALLRHPMRTILCIAYTMLVILFFVQLARGYGFLVTPLNTLPLFQSVHVTVRFLVIFAIGIAAAGIYALVLLFRSCSFCRPYEQFALLFCHLMTVLYFTFGYVGMVNTNAFWMQVSYAPLREALRSAHTFSLPVFLVEKGHHDLTLVQRGTTSVHCHEPLFGYQAQHQITSIVPGTVTTVENGTFNMNNPACFQYPRENFCAPGDRISVMDRENFDHFLRGERTTWKLSSAQHIADWITGATLLFCITILLREWHLRITLSPYKRTRFFTPHAPQIP